MDSEGGSPQSSLSFAGLPSSTADISASRYVVVPVPYEATTEWLCGTRQGPLSIIESSRLLELYDHELDADVSRAGICTVDELAPDLGGPERMVAAVKGEIGRWLDRDKVPVMLGGEHTITIGAVQAFVERYDGLSVLQLDAHADLRDNYLGARFSQATVMRRVRELCPAAQAGVRSLSLAERQFIAEHDLPVLFWPLQGDANTWLAKLTSALTDTVYITIDADVFDSAVLPWVGTPEPGGLTWNDIWLVLRQVAQQKTIVGFDVVEFCPRAGGAASSAYMLAKLVYRLIGYIWKGEGGNPTNTARAGSTEQEATQHG
jgi:agmatinase